LPSYSDFLIIFIAASSGVWTSGETNPSAKSPATQQKKKTGTMSKKKFMEEVQALPSPPALSSDNDYPAMGLSELGQRLITEEITPTVTKQVKGEKPHSAPSSTTTKQVKNENKSTVPPNKKV
jgi:hypothetical protein